MEGFCIPNANNPEIVKFSQTANKFRSSIVLQYDNKYIDVKSILGLFTTLLTSSNYDLHVHGPDADEAKKAMAEVFEKHGLKINSIQD
ncbi:PTS sugar transporter [Paenibacillus sp. A3]|nr:PTS sugar transporter [Paenibacillus sp. A3]